MCTVYTSRNIQPHTGKLHKNVVYESTLNWEWYQVRLMFCYKTSYHTTTKSSLFELLYGMNPRTPAFSVLELERICYCCRKTTVTQEGKTNCSGQQHGSRAGMFSSGSRSILIFYCEKQEQVWTSRLNMDLSISALEISTNLPMREKQLHMDSKFVIQQI
jgi:hypothetical protein